jgi:hypothetical protein
VGGRVLQAVVLLPREPAVVAGVPAVLRTASLLASCGGIGRVLLYGASDGFRRSWEEVLRRMPYEGKALDAFGPIGGYNFLWAWSTGRAAGIGAARRITPA